MRFVKILFTVALLFIVVLAGYVITLDPNEFKPEIEKQITDLVGNPVKIEGDVSLDFLGAEDASGFDKFSLLSVELGSGYVNNSPNFPPGKMLSFSRISASIDLFAAIGGEVKVSNIFVKDAEVLIVENKDGKLNWDTIASSSSDGGDKGEEAAVSPLTRLGALSIVGIVLEDSRILWLDRKGHAVADLSDVDLSLGSFELGKPLSVDLKSDFRSDVYPLEAKAHLKGVVLISKDAMRIDIDDFSITGESDWKGEEEIEVEDIKISFDGSVNLATQEMVINKLKASAKVEKEDMEEDLAVAFSSAGKANLAVGDVALEKFSGNLADVKFQGSLQAKSLTTTPRGKLVLQSESFNPRKLAEMFSVELGGDDTKTLKKAKLRTEISFDDKSVSINKADLVLDDLRLEGEAKLYLEPKVSLVAKVKIDKLRIEDYLPEDDDDKDTDEKKTDLVDIFPFPVTLTVDIDRMFYEKAEFNNTHVELIADKKALRAQNVRTSAFGGGLKGDAVIATGTKPTRSMGTLSQIQLRQALKAFLGEDSLPARLKGQASADWRLTSTGSELERIKQNMSGKVNASLKNVTILDEKYVKQLRTAIVTLNGTQGIPDNFDVIGAMTANANFINGVSDNTKLKGDTALFVVNGEGKIDLRKDFIDLRIRLIPKKILQFDDVIPVKVKGDIASPSFQLDIEEILKNRAKKEAEKFIRKTIKEKVQEAVKGGALKEAIKGKVEETKEETKKEGTLDKLLDFIK